MKCLCSTNLKYMSRFNKNNFEWISYLKLLYMDHVLKLNLWMNHMSNIFYLIILNIKWTHYYIDEKDQINQLVCFRLNNLDKKITQLPMNGINVDGKLFHLVLHKT